MLTDALGRSRIRGQSENAPPTAPSSMSSTFAPTLRRLDVGSVGSFFVAHWLIGSSEPPRMPISSREQPTCRPVGGQLVCASEGEQMIRRTLPAVKAATFCVLLPNPPLQILPLPKGSGFFVSPDGWFVTAAHILMKKGQSIYDIQEDLGGPAMLVNNSDPLTTHQVLINMKLSYADPENDFALLKVDLQNQGGVPWLVEKTAFPNIEISTRPMEDGAPVYSYGYPLPDIQETAPAWLEPEVFGLDLGSPRISAVTPILHPRVTSAIISAGPSQQTLPPPIDVPIQYVIDKALNHGNSGGPIIATETGKVFALCSAFQTMNFPQTDLGPTRVPIRIPSLYGIVSSLSAPRIVEALRQRGIPISEQ